MLGLAVIHAFKYSTDYSKLDWYNCHFGDVLS